MYLHSEVNIKFCYPRNTNFARFQKAAKSISPKFKNIYFLELFSLVDSLWISYHITQSHSSPCPPATLQTSPRKENKQSRCGNCSVPHKVYPLTKNVHYNETQVWFQASGFHYTINTRSSLGLLSNILLLRCVTEILQFWIHRTGPFTDSSSSQMG